MDGAAGLRARARIENKICISCRPCSSSNPWMYQQSKALVVGRMIRMCLSMARTPGLKRLTSTFRKVVFKVHACFFFVGHRGQPHLTACFTQR